MKSHVINNLDELAGLIKSFTSMDDVRIGQVLCHNGLLNERQLGQALREQKLLSRRRVGEIIVEKGWVSEADINVAMAYKLGIPVVKINNYHFNKQALSSIDREFVRQYRLLPLGEINGRLIVATDCPFNSNVLQTLRFNVRLPVDTVLASTEDLDVLAKRYLSGQQEADALDDMGIDASELLVSESTDEALEKPVVQLVSHIVSQAVESLASDINLRPGRDSLSLFYRLDGKMTHIKELSKLLLPALVSRIKILGEMNIAERRLPQDGHAVMQVGDKKVDLRISVVPTLQGESVVIRILDKHQGFMSVDNLGIDERGVAILKEATQKQQGMILVTGPTGAGKSTTLYSLVQHARGSRDRHVLTIEDPVEYELDGIEQVQVMPKRGFNFASALRQFLRHDPDVIMVGEIRDDETAQIANKAALTGHVVLSTLHTRDAISTVQRLYDMGVEPYLLASTLNCVVAQRLVRKVCVHCRVKDEHGYMKGRGCELCHHTGYLGRVGVAEVLEITSELADLIARKASRAELVALSESQGMQRLLDAGMVLVREGVTSLEEVLAIRVD